MIEIIPSILTNNPKDLRELLGRCEGVTERVQIDVVDGIFVENRSVDLGVFSGIETDLNLDFHLMVKEPINWVERCIQAGADRIIGQIEMMQNQVDFVGKIQEVGASVGLALDLDSPVTDLDSTILNSLDVVLIMSVKAGFGGQEFDKKALKKIKDLDDIRARDDTPFKIQDDGGITLQSVYNVHRLGVEEVSIGRKLFEGDLGENLKKFQKAAHEL